MQTDHFKSLLQLVFGYKCVCVLVNVSIKQKCHMLTVWQCVLIKKLIPKKALFVYNSSTIQHCTYPYFLRNFQSPRMSWSKRSITPNYKWVWWTLLFEWYLWRNLRISAQQREMSRNKKITYYSNEGSTLNGQAREEIFMNNGTLSLYSLEIAHSYPVDLMDSLWCPLPTLKRSCVSFVTLKRSIQSRLTSLRHLQLPLSCKKWLHYVGNYENSWFILSSSKTRGFSWLEQCPPVLLLLPPQMRSPENTTAAHTWVPVFEKVLR